MNTKFNYMTIVAACILTAAGYHSEAIAQGPSGQNQLLAQARAATAVYHDIDVALEDGFTPALAGVCHGDENGAVGISYVNTARFVSPEVNELEPEFLNYIPTGDGNVRLVSVAYSNRVLFRDTRPPDTPGYRPGIFVWQQPVIPPYLEEVSGAFSVFGEQAGGPIFIGRWIYLITVHIWANNPLGMFAVGNPLLQCPE